MTDNELIRGIRENSSAAWREVYHANYGKMLARIEPMLRQAKGKTFDDVYSETMVALMENVCAESVQGYLPEGSGTVGISLDIKHTAATPVGMEVRCESELTEIDRRRLVFSVVAYDAAGEIGRGTHERFIIDNARFMDKVNAKKA